MSAFGAALAKGLAALGGPVPATAIVAGGLVVGAIGGGFVATGGGQGVTSEGELAVYACPGTGSALLTIAGGQRLLATGRTEDSAWLRIHYPDPGRNEAWVESGPLQASGSIADLPVAACAPEPIVAVPSFAPVLGLTAIQDNPPTPSPTGEPVATPTPTPTPAIARNERPALANLTASPRTISFDTGDYCPRAESTATFRVRAEDDDGVASVGLFWREPGSGSFVRAAMNRVGGGARDGTWQVALDTARNGITQNGQLAYYAVATDTDGATRRLPGSGSNAIQVERCVNEGPDITSVRSSGGSPLFEDPFGVSRCQTATNITAEVRDSQGVDSVRLFYRRPADGGFQSKPMTLQNGRWFANLDTLGDKITINDPPTGTLRWYIQATDDEGEASRIDTRVVTIRRCDTETVFQVASLDTDYAFGCQTNDVSIQLFWQFSANDRDLLRRATLRYELVALDNGRRRSETITQRVENGRFQFRSSAFNGPNFQGDGEVTWSITTEDQFGGTTRYQAQDGIVISPCFG